MSQTNGMLLKGFGALVFGTTLIFMLYQNKLLQTGCNQVAKRNTWKTAKPTTESLSFGSITNRTLYTPGVVNPPAVLLFTKGGLGNQLFEYACHYAVARKNNWPLYISTPNATERSARTYETNKREFALDSFNIPLYDWNSVDSDNWNITGVQFINDSVMLTGQYPFDKVIRQSGGDYCQSENFFAPYKSEILELFKLKEDPIENLIDENAETVAVHIRRGDFIRLNISISYKFYKDSMVRLTKTLKTKPKFYIFSDDIKTIEQELFSSNEEFPQQFEVNFVGGPGLTSSIQEFFLMLKCKHQIISNSTFSWWAAYLNTNPGKIVIAANVDVNYFERIYSSVEQKQYFMWAYGHIYYPYEWFVVNPS